MSSQVAGGFARNAALSDEIVFEKC